MRMKLNFEAETNLARLQLVHFGFNFLSSHFTSFFSLGNWLLVYNLLNIGLISDCVQDHKPSNEPEKERIQNAGGSVMIQRVNGSLAVSRALGDFEYKNVEGKGPTEQLGQFPLPTFPR